MEVESPASPGILLLRPRGAGSGGHPRQPPRPESRFRDEGAAVPPHGARVPLSKVPDEALHRVLNACKANSKE